MKKIAVYFNLPQANDYPLSKDMYKQAYWELTEAVSKVGGELYIVRGIESYQGQGKFTNSWQLQGLELVETGPVQVEVVYDKGTYNQKEGVFVDDGSIPIFNSKKVDNFCSNKWNGYQIFPQYYPQSFLVKETSELKSAIEKVNTDLVVIKPVAGSEGRSVSITSKKDLLANLPQLDETVIVQDFLDTSGGVSGIVEGMHDLRVALFDGEILYSYFRTPPQNSYLANVARGGAMGMVPPEKVPSEVASICKEVDAHLSDVKHRFYSVDFGLTAQGPKIMEMNARLGLLDNSTDPIFVTLKEKLAQAFMDL